MLNHLYERRSFLTSVLRVNKKERSGNVELVLKEKITLTLFDTS